MNQAESGTATQIVKCEKHGLRYNAATQSGCVRCRREAGEFPKTGATRAPERTARQGMSLSAALAISALLVLATSFAMLWIHTQVYDQTQRLMESDGYEEFTPDGYEELTPEEREKIEELFREP